MSAIFADMGLPANLDELKSKVGELPGALAAKAGEVGEKCVVQWS